MSPTLPSRRRPPLSRLSSKKSDGEKGNQKFTSPPKGLANMIRKPSIIDRLNDSSSSSYRNFLDKIDSKELSQEFFHVISAELIK